MSLYQKIRQSFLWTFLFFAIISSSVFLLAGIFWAPDFLHPVYFISHIILFDLPIAYGTAIEARKRYQSQLESEREKAVEPA